MATAHPFVSHETLPLSITVLMTSAATVSRSSKDLLSPLLRRHRKEVLSDRTEREIDEIWPQDETIQAYDVGATGKDDTVSTAPYQEKLRRGKSRRSLVGRSMVRVVDNFPLQGRRSALYIKKEQGMVREHARRSVTEVERDTGSMGTGGDNSSHFVPGMVLRNTCEHKPNFGKDGNGSEDFMQGHCRMAWFAGLKCTRFLRLTGGTLQCFDSGVKRSLWNVRLVGAKVRVHHIQNKIVLSKLHGGYTIEFYLFDAESCRSWGSTLLRASTPTMSEWSTEYFDGNCRTEIGI